LLDEFFENYEQLLIEGFCFIRDEYKKNLISLNKAVKVNIFDEILDGVIKDIDFKGQLILLDKKQNEIVINVGDVIFSK